MPYHPPPPNTVDVGRSTIFGNPHYNNGIPGSTLPAFEAGARSRMAHDIYYREAIKHLHGKTLWCPGCGLNSPTCHARVLERLSQELQP